MKMDSWIKEKIGISNNRELSRADLEKYQLEKLVETISMAKENSCFYSERLKDIDVSKIKTLKDIEKIPFTTVDDLRNCGIDMLCKSQSQISRIVTLDTSGTTGKPKRVYYTENDQELTKDFFHNGMQNLVDLSDVVMILLPCETPGTVGDLLDTGLGRIPTKTVKHGLLKGAHEIPAVLEKMVKEGVTSIVGSPTQVSEMARFSSRNGQSDKEKETALKIKSKMKSVLLSTEYVSEESCEDIRKAWDCKVFEHYGMTEMGLGGAVSCFTLEGYHPREADLYFEIINPDTGKVLPDGEFGEVVFTTMTREGMPFIRYRTGDQSRWLTEPCECGSLLRRLDKVGDRVQRKKLGGCI